MNYNVIDRLARRLTKAVRKRGDHTSWSPGELAGGTLTATWIGKIMKSEYALHVLGRSVDRKVSYSECRIRVSSEPHDWIQTFESAASSRGSQFGV